MWRRPAFDRRSRIPAGDPAPALYLVSRQLVLGGLVGCASGLALLRLIPSWLGAYVLAPMATVLILEALWERHRVVQYHQAIGTVDPLAFRFFDEANALLNGHDYAAAEASLRRALECDDTFPAAHNNLGIALLGQQRRDEALRSWAQALALVPRYPDALQNRAAALGGESLPE